MYISYIYPNKVKLTPSSQSAVRSNIGRVITMIAVLPSKVVFVSPIVRLDTIILERKKTQFNFENKTREIKIRGQYR